jgi:predicted phosphodiesterase
MTNDTSANGLTEKSQNGSNDKNIYIIGDIHGKFSNLKKLIDKTDLRDCHLICVGDLGLGFQYDEQGERYMCELFNNFLAERDIEFKSIRGNHDDPKYFTGDSRISLSHFKMLPDYHFETLNGEKFLFVGGAISIDRRLRIEGRSYWKDETFELKDDKIVECDVLITHSTPTWLGPFDKQGILSWCDKDEYLWRDCLKEREDITLLYRAANPKKSYSGHFHQHFITEQDGCIARILDELEIVEHR